MTYREQCQSCGRAVAGGDVVFVCSFDCTFCAACAAPMEGRCPNCGGELARRPRRGEIPGPLGASERSPDSGRTPAVAVERVGADRAGILAPLFDAYRQFYREAADLAGAESFLKDRLARNESVVFLARIGERAVGFTQLYPLFSSTAMSRLWLLNDLFVVPDVRRSGVATALLERAKAWAAETGATGVLLETAVDNPAQRLYEARGWERDREFLHYEWRRPSP